MHCALSAVRQRAEIPKNPKKHECQEVLNLSQSASILIPLHPPTYYFSAPSLQHLYPFILPKSPINCNIHSLSRSSLIIFASSISGLQLTITPDQVSKNLAAIGVEKVMKVVLVAEKTDHLAVRGQDQLLRDKTLFEEI